MDRQRAEDPTTSSSRILPTVQISDEAAASSASSSSSSAASVVPTSSSTSTRVSVVPPALANFVVPPPLATISNLPSPLNLERRSLSAMASLSSSPGRWLAYRDERTSSSSSDSGVVNAGLRPRSGSSVSSLAALSPPGLSPLNVNDSPFSTPTPSSTTTRSRFTFDHVPVVCSTHTYQHRAAVQSASVSFPVVGHSPSETEEEEKDDVMESERSAFELPDRRRSESLDQVLQGVRKGSSSIGGAVRQHQRLGRKPSVIQSASKTSESKDTSSTVSLNSQLTVKVSESSLNSILQSQLLMSQLYPSRQHLLLTSSLSSPLHATNSHARLTSSASTASFMLSPTSLAVGGGDPSPRSNASSELLSEDDPGKQQYLCHICKKDFKRPDILSRHVRRHTGEKPFGCESCGRFFSRSDHLRTHRRTHTDEKPYHCSICSYSARRRDVLTRHMSTRHQAKAGISIFQRHRDVRRCLSDGAALAAMPRGSRKRLTTTCSKSRRVDSAATDTTTNDEDGEVMPKMEDIEDDVIVDDNSGCSQNIGN